MLHGIGVDLLNRETIPDTCLEPGDPFLERTFTRQEIGLGMSREHPKDFFRGRFAAKEAVFKSLGAAEPRWKEIEVLALDSGAPRVFLSGKTAQEAGKMGIYRIHVSISWDRENYFAAAISEGEEK